MAAQNDWIVAGINNPDFTNRDFQVLGDMTVDNTQLLSKEEYLKSDYIKNNDAFKDEEGNFSERKFSDYYDRRVNEYGDFQEATVDHGPALDMFNTQRKSDTPTKDMKLSIGRGVNPDRQRIGVEGINVWSDPEFSRREIAKQNKVFDTETGDFRDYSVDDHTLVTSPVEWVKDLFKDPLVLATWDEDGTHIDPITGVEVEHHKGQEKLNEQGTYYYETLGGRSIMGKDVLSTFDTFTVDGQGINKYDFFDSNDIEKSVAGTIAKTAFTVLPLFLGPTVAGAYAAAQVGREFAKSLPMLYGLVTAVSDSETPEWINTLAALGERGTTSTSDYGKANTFTFEAIGGLAADVALQWGQQKLIAKTFSKIGNSSERIMKEAQENTVKLFNAKRPQYIGKEEELMEVCKRRFMPAAEKAATEAGQLGRDMSLAYMAITSNTDVYNDMLEHGASKAEAAAVTLGSTIGMFAVDKYLGLGEVFFDDATGDATKMARKALKDEFKNAQKMFDVIKQTETDPKNKLLKYISQAAKASKAVLSNFNEDLKYHTTSALGKMVGEGLEEVAEELVADCSKSIYELAGALGFNTSTKDVGAWDNWFDRYTMNFLGGVMGGGIFYGKEVWDKGSFHKPQNDQDIANLIRNGHVTELREQLAKLYEEGKTGNKSLSGTSYEITDNGKKIVWKSADSNNPSQADVVKNFVLDKINSIEEVLLTNRDLTKSDDELFDNMILSEERYKAYKNISGLTNYYEDYSNRLQHLINKETDYKKALKTIEGTVNGTIPTQDSDLTNLSEQQKLIRKGNLDDLMKDVVKAREEVDTFLSGDNSLDYTRKLNFAMDPSLHLPFLGVSQEEYFAQKHPGKDISQLSQEEINHFLYVEWPEYLQTQLKSNLNTAYQQYKFFGDFVNPHLSSLSSEMTNYKNWASKLEGLFSEQGVLNIKNLQAKYLNYESQLQGESDTDYANRNTKGANESDQDFENRRNLRKQKIDAFNDQIDQQIADAVDQELKKVNYTIDPITLNYIKTNLLGSKESGIYRGRIRDVFDRKIASMTSDPQIQAALRNVLNPSLSNEAEVVQYLRDLKADERKKQIEGLVSKIGKIRLKKENSNDTISIADLSDELSNTFFQGLKFGKIIDEAFLYDPNSDLYVIDPSIGCPYDLDNSSIKKLVALIDELKQLVPPNELDNLWLIDPATGMPDIPNLIDDIIDLGNKADQFVQQEVATAQATIHNIITSINNNPLYNLQSKINATVDNPVGRLIKEIAKAKGDQITDIDLILKTLQDDFDGVKDLSTIILDDVQIASLNKVKSYMQMLQVYLYAASTEPNAGHPIGHNKSINAFADSHKDKLRKEWEKLPEISADYVASCLLGIEQYTKSADWWIQFSLENQVKKDVQCVRIDVALNKALAALHLDCPRTIDIDGENFDILEGVDSLDLSTLTNNEGIHAQVALYNIERLLYKNINLFAIKKGLTVPDFIKKYGILEKIIPGLTTMDDQKNTVLSETLTKDQITDYTKLVYYLTIFTEDPCIFYSGLMKSVAIDNDIAPLTAQEFIQRITRTSIVNKDIYNDLFKHAYDLNPNHSIPFLPNTTCISGVAGGGKTSVCLDSVKSLYSGSDVWVAAPTVVQSSTLQKVVSSDTSSTIEQLFINILGDTQYKEIKDEVKSITLIQNGGGRLQQAIGKYFTFEEGPNQDGLTRLNTSSITFNQSLTPPKVIYIDEASLMSSVEAQILAEYARQVGAQVVLLFDKAQIGHLSRGGIENVGERSLWAIRPFELTISLRDANIQKAKNQSLVRSLLLDLLQQGTEAELQQKYKDTLDLIPKINFRYYKQDLTGEYITDSLTPSILSTLKQKQSEGKSIAFITDNKNSVYLDELRRAGINIPNENILSIAEMQGQEFDYIVTDVTFNDKLIVPGFVINFLSKLYTIMTRSRDGSIFIGNSLKKYIGGCQEDSYTALAPSIKNSASRLKQVKMDILNQLDLTPFKFNNQNPNQNPVDFDDFTDPENTPIDPNDQQIIDEHLGGDAEQDPSMDNLDPLSPNFIVEAYGDTFLTGFTTDPNDSTNATWNLDIPTGNEPLRNIQGLVDPTEASKVKVLGKHDWQQKTELEQRLHVLRSAILFEKGWKDIDNVDKNVSDRFTQKEWDNRTFEIEFRRVPVNSRLSLGSNYSTIGITEGNNKYYTVKGGKHKGDKVERLVPVVVCKIVNKEGKVCKFDVAGLNNPYTFKSKLPTIKKNLQDQITRINGMISNPGTDPNQKAQLQSVVTQLSDKLQNIDKQCNDYETWFDEQVNSLLDSGQDSFVPSNLDNVGNALKFKKNTSFRKRSTPIRVGGTFDPNHSHTTAHQKRMNLKSLNPDKVFSSVYIFNGKDSDILKINPKVAGKAVVFVTNDLFMNPKDLIDYYINQKLDPQNYPSKVRMIVLGNYGMSFKQLTDSFNDSLKKLNANGGSPFRMNFLGIRMFTSLWNARASIKRFNQELSRWKADNNLSDKEVEALIEAQDDVYRNKSMEAEAVLKAVNPSWDLKKLDLLKDFNENRCKDIPMFRLGYDRTGKNGFHIQQFDVSNSIAYSKTGSKANLCVITPKMATKWEHMIDEMMSPLVGSRNGLGLKFEVEVTNAQGQKVKNELTELDFIDPDDAAHQRTLSGLLSKIGGEVILRDKNTQQKLVFPTGLTWSAVPSILTRMAQNITWMREQGTVGVDPLDFDITYKAPNSNVYETLSIDYSGFFTDTSMHDALVEGKDDKSLLHMMSMIFNGSIEDFQNNPGVIQLTDAYFKHGFMINPMITIKTKTGNSKTGYFWETANSEESFTSDVDIVCAGVQIDMSVLYGQQSGQNPGNGNGNGNPGQNPGNGNGNPGQNPGNGNGNGQQQPGNGNGNGQQQPGNGNPGQNPGQQQPGSQQKTPLERFNDFYNRLSKDLQKELDNTGYSDATKETIIQQMSEKDIIEMLVNNHNSSALASGVSLANGDAKSFLQQLVFSDTTENAKLITIEEYLKTKEQPHSIAISVDGNTIYLLDQNGKVFGYLDEESVQNNKLEPERFNPPLEPSDLEGGDALYQEGTITVKEKLKQITDFINIVQQVDANNYMTVYSIYQNIVAKENSGQFNTAEEVVDEFIKQLSDKGLYQNPLNNPKEIEDALDIIDDCGACVI